MYLKIINKLFPLIGNWFIQKRFSWTREVRISKKDLFKNMASQNYLIAIALIEQNLVRAMPLGGKEIKDNLEES